MFVRFLSVKNKVHTMKNISGVKIKKKMIV